MINTSPLQSYSPAEKTAYIQAIASIATADRTASAEELEYVSTLSNEVGLSESEKESVMETAKTENDDSLFASLEVLKNSELRFSLLSDLINFAESDQQYHEEEKKNVEKIATFLNINPQQFEALSELADETRKDGSTPEAVTAAGAFNFSGIQEKLKASGIDIGSLAKGLLATLGPLILAKVMGGRRSGGLSSGLGSGGLGSLISGLGGASGRSGQGGLLGNILSKLGR
ncbi:TerB family tellurite resistance protein [Daejeonella sp.]|uniref:TerB family tellurite resistance protein n=1 Tax=Daejeonella sp. TaxID=2805397 RepID=UPI00398367DA